MGSYLCGTLYFERQAVIKVKVGSGGRGEVAGRALARAACNYEPYLVTWNIVVCWGLRPALFHAYTSCKCVSGSSKV